MKYLVVWSTQSEDIYYEWFKTKKDAKHYLEHEIPDYKAYMFDVSNPIDGVEDRT